MLPLLHFAAMDKDRIYTDPKAKIADFSFDAQVADVFTDMIERSVPGYRSIITMIETLTEHYASPAAGSTTAAARWARRRYRWNAD